MIGGSSGWMAVLKFVNLDNLHHINSAAAFKLKNALGVSAIKKLRSYHVKVHQHILEQTMEDLLEDSKADESKKDSEESGEMHKKALLRYHHLNTEADDVFGKHVGRFETRRLSTAISTVDMSVLTALVKNNGTVMTSIPERDENDVKVVDSKGDKPGKGVKAAEQDPGFSMESLYRCVPVHLCIAAGHSRFCALCVCSPARATQAPAGGRCACGAAAEAEGADHRASGGVGEGAAAGGGAPGGRAGRGPGGAGEIQRARRAL